MPKTIDIRDILNPDSMATHIAERYQEWEMFRNKKKVDWDEIQRYIFATDTTHTTNSKLPWSNKTTIPKLCQIRDNLYTNYMSAMFPKHKWMEWVADQESDDTKDKKEVIESYMQWVVDRNEFYDVMSKLVYDYIDYGNCFAMPEWYDGRNLDGATDQAGYVGPLLRRISPLDIVFNPAAPSFLESPKIIRSLISIGEVKELLMRESSGSEEDVEAVEKLYNHLVGVRQHVSGLGANDLQVKDSVYEVAGFTSYRDYLESNYAEVLTFYGDIYDEDTGQFLKNYVVKIVDRSKVLIQTPNPSYFGQAPIYHAGWRLRPDNLWAMGPLDNLVGMQYRIDHIENMKADVYDLTRFPVIKIKGVVEDFEWGPMERIYVQDDGDVQLLSPDVQVLQADSEIMFYESKMEELAGAPREALGFRTPGEKTKFEVQMLGNSSGRVFMNKISFYERFITENGLNAMLELAKRNLSKAEIRVLDDEFKINIFSTITKEDLVGVGRIRPMAARNFAEKSQMIQDLTTLSQSPIYQDVKAHFSTIKLARLVEQLVDIEKYNLVEPFIRISEEMDMKRLMNSQTQNFTEEVATPAGILPGDEDPEVALEEPQVLE